MSKSVNTTPARDRFLKKDEVLSLMGNISSATLYRWIKARQFPSQVRMGPNRMGFLASEIDAHVLKLKAERDAGLKAEGAR